MANEPHHQPSDVTAEEGEVHIDGPDGVAVSMTPHAALETADRLTEGASTALGQRAMKAERDRRPG